MSITNARNFIEKSGCGWITGGALILVMVASVFTFNSCGGDQQNQVVERPVVPLAAIGTEIVDGNEMNANADQMIQQAAGTEEGIDPADEGRTYSSAAQSLISQALVRFVAKERGLAVTQEELIKDFESSFEGQLFQSKFEMINRKLLKPDASEADFAAAFKNATGREIADVKAEELKRFTDSLNDPEKKKTTEFNLLAKKVSDSYKAKVTISDADLKKGFVTHVTKRLLGSFQSGTPQEVRAKIEKAEAELKAGASFESLMNKYSDDPAPAAGKPKSDSTINLSYATLTYDVSLKPILNLKPGQVSPILTTAQGPALFKIIKIEDMTPKDFEKRKDSIREERLNQLATKAASDDLRSRLGQVKYESPATKLFVEWRIAMGDPELAVDRSKLSAKLKSIYEDLKVVNDALLEPRMVSLGTYGAFMDYHDSLPPAKRPEVAAERMELLAKALESSPHIESFHELTKLAIAQKSGAIAFGALKDAMSINAGSSDLAVTRHKAQTILRDQLVASKLAKPDQIQELGAELARWKTDLYEDMKSVATGNADYSDLGEAEFKTQRDRVSRFRTAGFLTAAQATEISKLVDTWKEGVFGDLKLIIEENTDYTDIGESNYKDVKARVEKYAKLGYITAAQSAQLQTLLANWAKEKIKYDAEEAKNAPKPEQPKSGPQAPKTTGGASSNDLLKGGSTGN